MPMISYKMSNESIEELESMFLTSDKFYIEVNELVWEDDITYMEAIMLVCDAKEIDPEDLVKLKLISPLLKQKLQDEAIEVGLLKTTSKLPL